VKITAEEDKVMKKIRYLPAYKVDGASAVRAEILSKIGQSQSLGHVRIVNTKVFATTTVSVSASVRA